MATELYDLTVPPFTRGLRALDGLIDKAVAHAEATGGGEMKFLGQPYVTGFAIPNFYFHLTTAYDLLRGAGVPIGKRDYMGGV